VPKTSKRQQLSEYLAAQGWASVGTQEWQQLRADFPEWKERSLRQLLSQCGAKVEQPWAGVNTKSLEQLEASLTAMTEVYALDPELGKLCRTLVIAAKDQARFVSRSARVGVEKREVKKEMVEWMLVWLGDPAMFPTWAGMRKAQSQKQGP
jgi:hypothetical protein